LLALVAWLLSLVHSFKNQTSSLVGPEKTGTSDLTGLVSAQDRPTNKPEKSGEPAGFKVNRQTARFGVSRPVQCGFLKYTTRGSKRHAVL
jgi:hypothetical protein